MCSIMGYIGSRIPEEEFKLGFDMTVSRGPDMSRLEKLNNGFLGVHRLAIMGPIRVCSRFHTRIISWCATVKFTVSDP